jgi:hypothetical protein
MATVMSENPDVELLRRTWEAIAEGVSGVEAALATDAKWRAIEDDPWNCAYAQAGKAPR